MPKGVRSLSSPVFTEFGRRHRFFVRFHIPPTFLPSLLPYFLPALTSETWSFGERRHFCVRGSGN